MININNVIAAVGHYKEAERLMASGPLEYYIRQLVAAYNTLIDKYAPFKKGDYVTLVKAPDFIKAPSWAHCKHFLIPGAVARVKEVSFGEFGFTFYVEFEDETWIDYSGSSWPTLPKIKPVETKHLFNFTEEYLEYLP